MNTLHLQYIIEIERTRSISQAAENLYIGQPNLSRVLREMEHSVGFPIFERTPRGVRPTQRGAEFLAHARIILREVEAMDTLGPRHSVVGRLRACMPRSSVHMAAAAQFLRGLSEPQSLDVVLRECHPRQALQYLKSGEMDLALIRYRSEYRDYFQEQAEGQALELQEICPIRFQILLSRDHPLADRQTLRQEDLLPYPEIVHGELYRSYGKPAKSLRRRIYTTDRMAQITLLTQIHGAYLWSAPVCPDLLAHWGLVQRPCSDPKPPYFDALLYHGQYHMTEMEQGFLEALRQASLSISDHP